MWKNVSATAEIYSSSLELGHSAAIILYRYLCTLKVVGNLLEGRKNEEHMVLENIYPLFVIPLRGLYIYVYFFKLLCDLH